MPEPRMTRMMPRDPPNLSQLRMTRMMPMNPLNHSEPTKYETLT